MEVYDTDAWRDKILSKVEVVRGCWEWQGYRTHGKYCGYGQVWDNDLRMYVGAHRVSYAAFIEPFDKSLFVCHRCDNTRCCSPPHLFVGTQFDNMRDASKKGRTQVGSDRHNSKLTEDQVIEIRRRAATDEYLTDIAKSYGITIDNVTFIATGATWKHVGGTRSPKRKTRIKPGTPWTEKRWAAERKRRQ